VFNDCFPRCSFQVLKNDGTERVVRSMHQGQYFGELGLVLDKSCSANIRLKPKSKLMYLEKKDFLKWSNRSPELLAELNIRTQGRDVPLIHILRHSRGYKEFQLFLKSELSPEGAVFWRAVDVLQDRCELWLSWRSQHAEASAAPRRIEPNMSTSRVKIPYAASKSMVVIDPQHSHVTMMDNVTSLLEMCESIYENHIKDMSVLQINIPMTMARTISTEYEALVTRARAALATTQQGGCAGVYCMLYAAYCKICAWWICCIANRREDSSVRVFRPSRRQLLAIQSSQARGLCAAEGRQLCPLEQDAELRCIHKQYEPLRHAIITTTTRANV
jgi:hypothetical protein